MPQTPITLRPMRPADAAAAVRVIHDAFATNAALIDPPASAAGETAANLVAWLDTGGGAIALATSIVGVVLWQARDGGLYIARLAVLPACRGQGIARRLMACAEDAARTMALPRLHLGTRLALAGNRRLFASCGFVEVAEHAHPGYDRPTWVELEKRLA